jgi:DHA1 family tetracycline resistance protein-like MFS transporter
MSEQPAAAAPRRAAIIFIFVTVLLDMLAVGIIIPVLPSLVLGFVGGDAKRTAEMLGLFGTVWASMQFLFSPVQGALSDRFGRRPVILLSNLGLGADYIVMALAPNLGWLLFGRVLSGITSASVSTAFAYIADVLPPEKRAGGFGLIGAAFGVGFVLGPAIGGLLGGMDPRLPFWVAAGFSFVNFLYGYFVLPESLKPENRAAFEWKRANPIGAFALLRSHRQLLGLASVYFLGQLAHVVLPSTFVVYAIYRYGWDERTVGLTLAAVGICSFIVQGGIVRPTVKRLGERRTLMVGLVFGVIGFLWFGLAATGREFWAAIPIMAFWGLWSPALQGLMTRRVGPTEQGRLQGANASLQGVAGLIGPALFTLSFAYAIDAAHGVHLPGVPFLIAALLLLAGGMIGWQASRGETAPAGRANPAH